MNDTSLERLAAKIAALRQRRGMTQAQFAKAMNTSQSAINRIERGKQNLSLEMIERIGEVLNQNVVEISGDNIDFKIEGGHELSGNIVINSSKNATMGLICAALLNQGTTKLINVPKIEEVHRMVEVLRSINVGCEWDDNSLTIQPKSRLSTKNINVESAIKTRSVIMLMAPLMHRKDSFNIPFSGGCNLGKRTVSPHLSGLKQFGLQVTTTDEEYLASTKELLQPKSITLQEAGDTVTENMIMAAALTPGVTWLHYASANYAVQDLCFMLKNFGVKFEGIGTPNLKITGVSQIKKDIEYTISEDPIEAMSFISAAVTTNSSITVQRAPIDFLYLELQKLQEMGVRFKISKAYKAFNQQTNLVDIAILKHDYQLTAPSEKLHPMPFLGGGINADNLPFFAPVACIAKGRTLIHDWMYENRAIYLSELNKLGAKVETIDIHRAVIAGPVKFKPADVIAPPALRPSVIILIAMLAASGTSTLSNVYPLRRGYESLAERLNSLGAKVTIIKDI